MLGKNICRAALETVGSVVSGGTGKRKLTKYPFLNSGAFFGSVYGIQKLLRRYFEVFRETNEHDDQAVLL